MWPHGYNAQGRNKLEILVSHKKIELVEYRQNLKQGHTIFGGPILLLSREHFLLENMENVTEIQENVVFNHYTEDDETRIRK